MGARMPETASTKRPERRNKHDGYAWIATNGPRRRVTAV